ncbi:MAG: hypothetical protein U9R08_00990 [Nanoarchaeota archaeon]|nr:hypothetical protein [Nanoarchaeota archaeon]
MTKLNNTEETNFEEINNTDELNIDSYEEEQNEDIEGEVEEQKEEVSVNKGNNLKKELAIQNRVLKREGYTKVEGK